MCIIVAKNEGIKMPSMETLRNCFTRNPDGAGFMLAAKNTVYGFKGLMTFSEFEEELKKARKRFGDLDKLAVVLHFRISTHGSSVGGNTHPFPLRGGYREMRKTEWQADQGFAHNGIIAQTSLDKDIKKHNVSDTMVFAKKYINPIARYASIAEDKEILNMLFELADSKLCFLSKKGKIATRGNFIEHDGVLYSNSSYEEPKKIQLPSSYSFMNYYSYGDKYEKTCFSLSKHEMEEYMYELADDNGFYPLAENTMVRFDAEGETCYMTEDNLFISDEGNIYRFDEDYLEFYLWATPDEYSDFGVMEEETE